MVFSMVHVRCTSMPHLPAVYPKRSMYAICAYIDPPWHHPNVGSPMAVRWVVSEYFQGYTSTFISLRMFPRPPLPSASLWSRARPGSCPNAAPRGGRRNCRIDRAGLGSRSCPRTSGPCHPARRRCRRCSSASSFSLRSASRDGGDKGE